VYCPFQKHHQGFTIHHFLWVEDVAPNFNCVCSAFVSYVAKEAEALQQQGTPVGVEREPILVHYHFAIFKPDFNCGANAFPDVVDLPSLSGVSCVNSKEFFDLGRLGIWPLKRLDGNRGHNLEHSLFFLGLACSSVETAITFRVIFPQFRVVEMLVSDGFPRENVPYGS